MRKLAEEEQDKLLREEKRKQREKAEEERKERKRARDRELREYLSCKQWEFREKVRDIIRKQGEKIE